MAHIQIRISEEEKEYAQQLFSSMGLTMSGAIKLFIRKSIQNDALPFDVSANFEKKKKKKKKSPPLVVEETEPTEKEHQRNFSNFINRDI